MFLKKKTQLEELRLGKEGGSPFAPLAKTLIDQSLNWAHSKCITNVSLGMLEVWGRWRLLYLRM